MGYDNIRTNALVPVGNEFVFWVQEKLTVVPFIVDSSNFKFRVSFSRKIRKLVDDYLHGALARGKLEISF